MAKVLLINRELGPGQTLVQGWSGGITYGTSKWTPSEAGQVLELTPCEYERCINDLAAAWHLPLRKWIPHFVMDEEDDLRAKLDESRALVETLQGQIVALQRSSPPPIRNEFVAEGCEQFNSETPLEKLPFFTLRKIAKLENVNISELKGAPAVVNAITAARAAKAT